MMFTWSPSGRGIPRNLRKDEHSELAWVRPDEVERLDLVSLRTSLPYFDPFMSQVGEGDSIRRFAVACTRLLDLSPSR